MKITLRKLYSLLLILTLLSTLICFSTSADEIKTDTAENSDIASFYMVEDEHGVHYYGPTGNNMKDNDESVEDTEIITSLKDYNNITKDKNSGNSLIRKATKLPDNVDNSQSIYFPEIGDQLNLGSCLFWAQIYYQYTYEYNKMMGIPTTADTVFSPQWSYNVATAGDDMQCTTVNSLNFMKHQGSVPMNQVPYDEQYLNAYPTEEVWRNSINYRIKEYYFFEDIGNFDTPITSPNDSDLIPIKTALNNGDILSFSTMMYGWTHTELKANEKAPGNDEYVGECAVTSMDSYEGGHRMTLVGYDDNIWIDINNNSKVDSGEMGAFKIANSWGKEYGNEGFCWVSYDALNLTSCVDGVPENKERSNIFEEVTKLEVQPYGTDTDIYFKFTLNTADRTQISTIITAKKDGTTLTRHATSNMAYGVPLAYDGSQYATDATLIIPIQAIFPDVTSENFTEYTWKVQFKDLQDDNYSLTVLDAVFVDELSGHNYEVSDCFPFLLNAESKTILYNESKLNHALIYYRGFYTPYINYKLDTPDAQWQKNIPIDKNFEQYGYTHKFIIDLESADSATLYFTDEDGNIDDNNGLYFTANKDFNYYITENMAKPLKVTMENDMEDVCDVGRFGLFTTVASGGYEPYQYEYVITNLTTGEITNEGYEDDRDTRGIYFNDAGDYEITVNVKDCAGTIASYKNFLTVAPIPFEFTTFDAKSTNDNLVNLHPITFTAVTNYESIGVHYGIYNEYDFTIKRGDELFYTTKLPMKYELTNAEYMTTTVIAKWTPTQTGTFTATISGTDLAGEYAEKTITFTVHDCIVGDADGDGNVSIFDATFLQMRIAKIIKVDSIRMLIADADKDGEITIKDATLVQRYVAQLQGCESVGEVIYS